MFNPALGAPIAQIFLSRITQRIMEERSGLFDHSIVSKNEQEHELSRQFFCFRIPP